MATTNSAHAHIILYGAHIIPLWCRAYTISCIWNTDERERLCVCRCCFGNDKSARKLVWQSVSNAPAAWIASFNTQICVPRIYTCKCTHAVWCAAGSETLTKYLEAEELCQCLIPSASCVFWLWNSVSLGNCVCYLWCRRIRWKHKTSIHKQAVIQSVRSLLEELLLLVRDLNALLNIAVWSNWRWIIANALIKIEDQQKFGSHFLNDIETQLMHKLVKINHSKWGLVGILCAKMGVESF